MMILENKDFSEVSVKISDLFICAFGYETRSTYLCEQFAEKICPNNLLIFSFDYLRGFKHRKPGAEYEAPSGATVISVNYDSAKEVLDHIQGFIKERTTDDTPLSIHIDYSGMPRSWYCRFPSEFEKFLSPENTVYFWYVDGHYDVDYKTYPCAGIENYVLFSGKPTLRSDRKRVHIICLGYDNTRTLAAISTLDPECLIVCDAYDTLNEKIHDNVIDLNESIISRAAQTCSFRMDDFVLMLSSLCELASGYAMDGDVILVPDGPKPLIFAMSLVPRLVHRAGITCLHITRNREHFSPAEVYPTKRVIGFSLRIS